MSKRRRNRYRHRTLPKKDPNAEFIEHQRKTLFNKCLEYRDTQDKWIFAAGAAGIGYCLSQFFKTDLASSVVFLLALSSLLFLFTCATAYHSFRLNSKYCNSLFLDIESEQPKQMKTMDRLTWISFVFGAGLLMAAAISNQFLTQQTSEKHMKEKPKNSQKVSTPTVKKNMDGIVFVKPSKPVVAKKPARASNQNKKEK